MHSNQPLHIPLTANISFTPYWKVPSLYGAVPRTEVTLQLNVGLSHKVTLVTAPAGYGKTSAMILWVRQILLPVLWDTCPEIHGRW